MIKYGSLRLWKQMNNKGEIVLLMKAERNIVRDIPDQRLIWKRNHRCVLRRDSEHFYHCILCGSVYTTNKLDGEC